MITTALAILSIYLLSRILLEPDIDLYEALIYATLGTLFSITALLSWWLRR